MSSDQIISVAVMIVILFAGSHESDRSQPAGSAVYFRNPAQNIPVHSNPFAGFPEARRPSADS